jgi:release factor glutamine methyltransferase
VKASSSDTLTLIREGCDYLEQHGVPNARRNAEWLLSHLLGCNRADLYLRAPREASRAVVEKYEKFVLRRGAREPLQYIIGTVEFMSYTFFIIPGVFIPRFETELLVERVEAQLQKRQSQKSVRLLDLCCGAGVIALSMVKRIPNVCAVGVDINEEAVALAEKNAALCGVSDRGEFVHGDAESYLLGTSGSFDVIVCNPPYIDAREIAQLPAEVREYEPLLGINGGEGGLDFYRSMLPAVPRHLEKNGIAAFEIGAGQGSAVGRLFSEASLVDVQIHQDYNHLDRVVIGKLPDISSR